MSTPSNQPLFVVDGPVVSQAPRMFYDPSMFDAIRLSQPELDAMRYYTWATNSTRSVVIPPPPQEIIWEYPDEPEDDDIHQTDVNIPGSPETLNDEPHSPKPEPPPEPVRSYQERIKFRMGSLASFRDYIRDRYRTPRIKFPDTSPDHFRATHITARKVVMLDYPQQRDPYMAHARMKPRYVYFDRTQGDGHSWSERKIGRKDMQALPSSRDGFYYHLRRFVMGTGAVTVEGPFNLCWPALNVKGVYDGDFEMRMDGGTFASLTKTLKLPHTTGTSACIGEFKDQLLDAMTTRDKSIIIAIIEEALSNVNLDSLYDGTCHMYDRTLFKGVKHLRCTKTNLFISQEEAQRRFMDEYADVSYDEYIQRHERRAEINTQIDALRAELRPFSIKIDDLRQQMYRTDTGTTQGAELYNKLSAERGVMREQVSELQTKIYRLQSEQECLSIDNIFDRNHDEPDENHHDDDEDYYEED